MMNKYHCHDGGTSDKIVDTKPVRHLLKINTSGRNRNMKMKKKMAIIMLSDKHLVIFVIVSNWFVLRFTVLVKLSNDS